MDCLIISYSEPNRDRERLQFFNEAAKNGSDWGRFLRLNYINYEGDIILPNNFLSIAKLVHEKKVIEKTKEGYFYLSDISRYSAWKIPLLGGLYLFQYLRQWYDVEIVQHAQLQKEEFRKMLLCKPKVIAISTTLILNPMDIFELVMFCRSHSPDSLIVLGGMSMWNSYLSNPDRPEIFNIFRADCIVVDPKGFKTLGMIVDSIKNGKSLNDVPNLILYSNGRPEITGKNPERFNFREDAIKWDLIDNDLIGQTTLLRTVISCPFNCSFCSYPATQGKYIASDMELFRLELTALQKRGVKYLLFTDDTFNFPKERFKELLTVLNDFNFYWYAFIRCQYLDKELVRDMKASGCQAAYLGIESGDDSMLKRMGKRATSEEYRKGIALLASEGIVTLASFIVGFPGDTAGSLEKTVQFIETSGIDFYNIKIFYYEHSAPIKEKHAEYGLSGRGMNWVHNTMTSAEAFAKTEDTIKRIGRVPYIPQHSGEIWEIAHLQERGFSKENIYTLYSCFTKMLQDELAESNSRIYNQNRCMEEVVTSCFSG